MTKMCHIIMDQAATSNIEQVTPMQFPVIVFAVFD